MDIGDRMKLYEKAEAGRRLMPLLPTMARIDGRCFHTFTKDLERPYDPNLMEMMRLVTKFLVEETQATVGYTQSDEINLLWHSESFKSQVFFDGKIQKMVSVLAALATARFNSMLRVFLPAKAHLLPVFDCRVWNVPNKVEAANVILWREMDATRNSIVMAAGAYYTHKQLLNKNTSEMQEMLFAKGVNWNDFPSRFKRGSYVQRKVFESAFTSEDLDKLPEKHHARTNPNLVVRRPQIGFVELPPLMKVANRVDVLFEGAKPEPLTEVSSAERTFCPWCNPTGEEPTEENPRDWAFPCAHWDSDSPSDWSQESVDFAARSICEAEDARILDKVSEIADYYEVDVTEGC